MICKNNISLDRGRIPKTGKKEAVLGSSVAKYFNVKSSDIVDIPISLSEDNSNNINLLPSLLSTSFKS